MFICNSYANHSYNFEQTFFYQFNQHGNVTKISLTKTLRHFIEQDKVD